MANTAFTTYNPGIEYIKTRSFDPTTPHYGIDYSLSTSYKGRIDIPVRAAADGIVVYSGINGNNLYGKVNGGKGYGNTVILEHTGANGSKLYTLYGHLGGDSMPRLGDIINRGQRISDAGNTGGSDGIHIHFEILSNAISSKLTKAGTGPLGFANGEGRIDPLFFSSWPTTGVFNNYLDSECVKNFV